MEEIWKLVLLCVQIQMTYALASSISETTISEKQRFFKLSSHRLGNKMELPKQISLYGCLYKCGKNNECLSVSYTSINRQCRLSNETAVPTNNPTFSNLIFEKDVDACLTSPCNANAVCTDFAPGFDCSCNSGYHGNGFNCTENMNCSLSPCNDGDCSDNGDGEITCTCNAGFTGTFCDVIDYCCVNLTLGSSTVGLYPFGDETGDANAGGQDDGCLGSFSQSVTMFGAIDSTLYVCRDGIISLSLPPESFAPKPFPQSSGIGVIAAFWADGDSRASGAIWYRETTNETLLNQISLDVNSVFCEEFNATWGLIVTWEDIKPYGLTDHPETNTFQAVVVTDDVETYVIYTYDHIDWTIAATLQTVIGQVGFDAGDGVTFVQVPGSGTPEIINIDNSTNFGTRGKYMFRLTGSDIDPADPCVNPCGDKECTNRPESSTFTCVT